VETRRAREEEERLRTRDEQLRIARELHDVVAHTMSVVALHAGTGRMVADHDPAAARDALATIETAARSAMLEMRQLVGMLRGAGDEGANDRAPAPSLTDLDALVADVARSGVTVEVRVEGDRTEVPAGLDVSAYRIVQEALTNVMKHADHARATLTVAYLPDAVSIEVADDGGGVQGRPPPPEQQRTTEAPSGGHGLVGMRERVAAWGGRLDAGPLPDGGYRVRALLPFGGAA
jgi:signal transduction histidine kinase